MKRISNEQREAIVRHAISSRDDAVADAPMQPQPDMAEITRLIDSHGAALWVLGALEQANLSKIAVAAYAGAQTARDALLAAVRKMAAARHEPVARVFLSSGKGRAPAELFLPLPAIMQLDHGPHDLYAAAATPAPADLNAMRVAKINALIMGEIEDASLAMAILACHDAHSFWNDVDRLTEGWTPDDLDD